MRPVCSRYRPIMAGASAPNDYQSCPHDAARGDRDGNPAITLEGKSYYEKVSNRSRRTGAVDHGGTCRWRLRRWWSYWRFRQLVRRWQLLRFGAVRQRSVGRRNRVVRPKHRHLSRRRSRRVSRHWIRNGRRRSVYQRFHFGSLFRVRWQRLRSNVDWRPWLRWWCCRWCRWSR